MRSVSPAVHLVGANRVGHFVHHVAAVQRVEDAQEEVEVHLQAGFGVGLVQAAGLLEQQHAEAVETGIAQRQAILGFVHAEAAGSAGAGGEEDVAVDDFLLGEALLFQALEILHQVADGEVGGIALAVVAVFLAGLEGPDVGRGHGFGAVAEAFQGAMDQLFVLPGEAAEEQVVSGRCCFVNGFSAGLLKWWVSCLTNPASFSSRSRSSRRRCWMRSSTGPDLYQVR